MSERYKSWHGDLLRITSVHPNALMDKLKQRRRPPKLSEKKPKRERFFPDYG